MAYYNFGLLKNGNNVQVGDYFYSSIGLRVTSPYTTITKTVTWSYGEYGDSVSLDFDISRTTVREDLTFNINQYIVIDNIRYEYVCWIDINPNGVYSYLSSTQIRVRPVESGSYTYSLVMAVFARRKFAATFDLNGGTGHFPDITFLSGKTFTLPTDEPTKEGFSFQGWLYDGSLYQAGDTSPVLYVSDTLVAQWTDVPPVPPPPTPGVSDALAYLPTTGALAFRSDTNSIVYNT